MISAQELQFTSGGKTLLACCSLLAKGGCVTAVLGPAGAGKTVLADILCGVLQPDGGKVLVDGEEMRPDTVDARKRISYVPKDPAVYRSMTPGTQLRFAGELLEISSRAIGDRIEKILKETGLSEVSSVPIRSLPRHMQQRVALAQALMGGVGNVVLDQPTSGMDIKQALSFRELLRSIPARTDSVTGAATAVLLTTDNLTEACALADIVYILDGGSIVGCTTPAELALLQLDDETTVLTAVGDTAAVRECVEKTGLSMVSCEDTATGTTTCTVRTGKGIDGKIRISKAFAAGGIPIVEMRSGKRGMEEIVGQLRSDPLVGELLEGVDGR